MSAFSPPSPQTLFLLAITLSVPERIPFQSCFTPVVGFNVRGVRVACVVDLCMMLALQIGHFVVVFSVGQRKERPHQESFTHSTCSYNIMTVPFTTQRIQECPCICVTFQGQPEMECNDTSSDACRSTHPGDSAGL